MVKVCSWPGALVAVGGVIDMSYALYCFVPDPVRVRSPEARCVIYVAVSVTRPGFEATIVTEHCPRVAVAVDVVHVPDVGKPVVATPLIAVICASSPDG
jgi:hypothetical protein